MSEKAPSLRDIAKAASVSVATVSLALRQHASIPEATRERIRAVASELGYVPNPRVAELMNHIRRNRAVETLSETVALFWSDVSRERVADFSYLGDFEQGARHSLREHGYGLDCYYQDPSRSPERLERMLRSKGIRGLILAPLMQTSGHTLDWAWQNFSVMVVGSANWEPDFNRVSFNHFGEMSAIMHQLHADGYHRIGLVVNSLLEARSQHTIVGGFWAGLETDVPKREAFFEAEADSHSRFLEWLDNYRPDSMIVAYPPALRWLEATQPSVPVVLRMVQDVPGNSAYPGIFQDFKRLGQVAAEQLIGQLQRNEVGIPLDPLQTSITGAWCGGSDKSQ
jgi:DNA-binding LacI/PurR family transcriptional regulator